MHWLWHMYCTLCQILGHFFLSSLTFSLPDLPGVLSGPPELTFQSPDVSGCSNHSLSSHFPWPLTHLVPTYQVATIPASSTSLLPYPQVLVLPNVPLTSFDSSSCYWNLNLFLLLFSPHHLLNSVHLSDCPLLSHSVGWSFNCSVQIICYNKTLLK